MKKLYVFAVLVTSASMLAAQSQPGTPTSAAAPVANAVSHTTKAMHYRPGANTKLPFQTTDLMPGAIGEAKIEAKKTTINIIQAVRATRHRERIRWSWVQRIRRTMVWRLERSVVQSTHPPSIPDTVRDLRLAIG